MSGIFFFVTLECAARIEDKLKWNTDLLANYSANILRCNDQYGVHSRFNTRYEKWNINSHGFRGPEVDFDVQPGVKRIMCLGASETLGLYEQADMEYPAQLRTILNKKNPGQFQVINAASLGISIPKATQHYALWLSKFNPDFVLYYPSPAFYLDETPPVPAKLTAANKITKKQFQFRISRKIELVLKKHIPETIQFSMKRFMIYNEVRKHKDGWVWNNPPSERLELFRKHLVDFIINIRKSGAKPVLMTHAHRFQEMLSDSDKGQLVNWRRFYPRASEKCLIDMENSANDIIREVGTTYHVHVVDLARAVPKGSEYFADFAHFTDAGASVVAEKIAETLIKNLNN